MKAPIRRGGVYRVPDHRITLPPDYARAPHNQRAVIVISGDAENENPDWPVVMVVPCSSQGSRATRYCVKLNHGVANVEKKCWARVVSAQPIAKDELGDYVGSLPANLLADIYVNLAAYMGEL